ncbi:hypothetical protein [Streptomyces sp. NPDC093223]|uniref:hypothetical protein n=1 Tax=Streptomyces sp. NPDC093223 TaxID=3366033 RepID=UPI003825C69F
MTLAAPADLMPPPSTALRAHQAAARIRTLLHEVTVDMQTNSYWSMGWHAGITNAVGGAAGDLAAAFGPTLAEEFADWLDEVASANARHGTPLPPLAQQAACLFTDPA